MERRTFIFGEGESPFCQYKWSLELLRSHPNFDGVTIMEDFSWYSEVHLVWLEIVCHYM